MKYHHSKHETCIVMDGTCMYNCPNFFLFWKCLDDMSYWTNVYRTDADNELHFFTVSNLNYTVFVSIAHMIYTSVTNLKRDTISQVWYRSCPNVEKVRTRQTRINISNKWCISSVRLHLTGTDEIQTMSMLIHG